MVAVAESLLPLDSNGTGATAIAPDNFFFPTFVGIFGTSGTSVLEEGPLSESLPG